MREGVSIRRYMRAVDTMKRRDSTRGLERDIHRECEIGLIDVDNPLTF